MISRNTGDEPHIESWSPFFLHFLNNAGLCLQILQANVTLKQARVVSTTKDVITECNFGRRCFLFPSFFKNNLYMLNSHSNHTICENDYCFPISGFLVLCPRQFYWYRLSFWFLMFLLTCANFYLLFGVHSSVI